MHCHNGRSGVEGERPITGLMRCLLSVFLLSAVLTGIGEAQGHIATLLPDRQRSVTNLDGTGVEVRKGAGGEKAFRLQSDGRLQFTAQTHPGQRNYVTLRLWSEDSGSRFTLKTAEGETITSLDHKTSGDIAPKQWYYSTRLIPRKFTNENEQLSLQLINATDQTSRAIYEISIHTRPRFQPGDHVPKTGTVKPYSYGPYEPPSKEEVDLDAWVKQRQEAADKTAKYIMSLQRYAPDWREKVEKGDWWGPLVGGFAVKTTDTLEKSKNATASHYKKRDNAGPLRGNVILARAYTLDGGKYEGDEEVLDRIAVGLDYMRRAQGANGGYVDVHQGHWVGGPNRDKGEGVLEGRVHRAQANALMLVHDDLKKAGLLQEKVDDDANPDTPPVPRRKAIRDLLHNSLTYLLNTRGHAPNQELMNVRALAPLHEALKRLGGYQSLGASKLKKKIQKRIAEVTGLKPVGRGSVNPYWISPKGISMEVGGLSLKSYGDGIADGLGALADLTGDQRIHRRVRTYAQAMSFFWYPVYHPDQRIDLREQEAWSKRGTGVHGGSASVSKWAALNGVSSHIRAYQLRIMAGAKFGPLAPGKVKAITGYDPHGWNSSVNILKAGKEASTYRELFEVLRNTDAPPLPHEAGQPNVAWVDPVAGAVAIKRGDQHVFMTLMTIDGADRKRAGVFEVTPRAQRRSVVYAQAPHGVPDDLTLVQYGSYFIAVNGSAQNAYGVDLPEAGSGTVKLRDMISGQTVQAGTRIQLDPGASAVFYPAN